MASSNSGIELDGDLSLHKQMASKMDLRGAKDSDGNTALHWAASRGCLESCRFLVEECGLDVNAVSKLGMTPMSYAAHEGKTQVIRYLLDRGVDPAIPDERGTTPLHNAALQGHCEVVRLLLSQGVPVDPIDHRGAPLQLAVSKDHAEVLKVLLEHSADPNKVANKVYSPVLAACYWHSLKCIKLLIEAGADVNAHCYPGPTPLMEAVNDGLTDFVKLLLDAGADPNIPTLEDEVSMEERIAQWKSRGKEAFAKEDYFNAMYYYNLVTEMDPYDATIFANHSLCWLRLKNGDKALEEARKCKMMRPRWSKAWYREGAALSFMKDHKGAADAFREALQLDPKNEDIKKALRKAEKAAEELQCNISGCQCKI
ncbi:protein TANC1-like isoform X2 [Lolium rigidum]|uniref:protein TANC1-like isoform X2 n=1 Tax=Lolium rigidum TaxID=89674 RepID=UPI001F5E0072|nr:protein TANC1-like isoform X2 [Lolium rigidum]